MANAAACGPGAEQHKGLVAQRRPGEARCREQCTGRYGRSALNVVVERAQTVAIAFEDAPGIGSRKIFPLQQYMRPAPLHCRDKLLDKVVVVGTAQPLMAPADIDRTRQPLAVVGAGVEQNWQCRRRVQPGAGGVEGELADRDAHTAGALIAEPQNAFAVADDDRLDPVKAGVAKDVGDAITMRPAEKKPARI